MTVIEYETQIAAPPEKIFPYLSDLQKHTEWSGGEAIEKMSDGPVAVGATYQTEEKGPLGLTLKEKSEVTQYQPNERFGWRAYGPMGSWLDWTFELQPQDGGTRLVERMVPQDSLLTTAMLKLFIERQMRASMPQSLAKIKARLEQS